MIVIAGPIVTVSLANPAAVTNRPPALNGSRGDRLKRLPVVVEIPDATRNDGRPVVLSPLDLRADLPLVIGAEECGLEMAERRLECRTDERQPAVLGRRIAGDVRYPVEMAGRGPVAGAGRVESVVDEAAGTRSPHRIRR